jgi:hypothetical protein
VGKWASICEAHKRRYTALLSIEFNGSGDALMNSFQSASILRASTAAIVLSATPLFAGPVVVDNPSWYEFGFFAPAGSFAVTGVGAVPSDAGNSQFADAPPWTFSSPTPVLFTVTDAFTGGDSFHVFDFDALVGTTPPVPRFNVSPEVSNPADAVTNPGFSHASFPLMAGSHSITISLAETPFTAGGAAYFRVDSVPEPMSLTLAAWITLVGFKLRRPSNG